MGWCALSWLAVATLGLCSCTLLVDTYGFVSRDDVDPPSDGASDAPVGADADATAPDGQRDGPRDVQGETDSAEPSPGIVGSWSFEEATGASALDSSGHGNTGTLRNGPTWTSGKAGGALAFDGLDDYVSIVPSPSVESISAALTVAAWVYRRSDQGAFANVTGRQAGKGVQDSFLLGFRDNRTIGIVTTTTGSAEVGGSTRALNGVWLHVALSYDGSAVRLYVGGQLDSSMNLSGLIAPESNPIIIGASTNNNQPDERLDARIDEVKIFSRALSATEIAALASTP